MYTRRLVREMLTIFLTDLKKGVNSQLDCIVLFLFVRYAITLSYSLAWMNRDIKSKNSTTDSDSRNQSYTRGYREYEVLKNTATCLGFKY